MVTCKDMYENISGGLYRNQMRPIWKNNTGKYLYIIVSVVTFIYIFIFFLLSIYESINKYGFSFDIDSNVKLTPIKAYELIDGSWEKKSYIGPNGGIGPNERGSHPITSVYIDFYVNNSKKTITLKANDVYGVSNLKKCKNIVDDGETIIRNVCYDSNNNVLGVSKGNPSVLNFYMQNSTDTFVLTVFFVLSVINTLFAIRMYIRMRDV